MKSITVESPAKINIGLNVVSKREDGFHNLETIFYPLLLSDRITFGKSDSFAIDSNSEELVSLKDNLITRAKELLEEKTGKILNVNIYIEKNIPMGAGLGGGSSNAATTLKALNQLFSLKLEYNDLAETALKLGSDVPFFLNPVPCFAESRGEIITRVPLSISYPILIVYPGIHISTKEAFEKITPGVPEKSLRLLTNKKSISLEDLIKFAKNDFEDFAFNNYPVIKEIRDKLIDSGAELAMMTGTGSSVFGIFTNLQKARWAEDDFRKDFFTFLNFPVDKGSIT